MHYLNGDNADSAASAVGKHKINLSVRPDQFTERPHTEFSGQVQHLTHAHNPDKSSHTPEELLAGWAVRHIPLMVLDRSRFTDPAVVSLPGLSAVRNMSCFRLAHRVEHNLKHIYCFMGYFKSFKAISKPRAGEKIQPVWSRSCSSWNNCSFATAESQGQSKHAQISTTGKIAAALAAAAISLTAQPSLAAFRLPPLDSGMLV